MTARQFRLHAAFMALLVLVGVFPAMAEPLVPGKPAPWFGLRRLDTDSGVMNLAKLQARLGNNPKRHAAVVFFAHWCTPCLAELRQIAARRTEFDKTGVPLLLVDASMDDDIEQTRRALASAGLESALVVRDRFGQMMRDWDLAKGEGRDGLVLPASVVLDGTGKVVATYPEPVPDIVERLLQGR